MKGKVTELALLLAACLLTSSIYIATAQDFQVCADYVSNNPCENTDENTDVCPPACGAWLRELPQLCKETFEAICPADSQADMDRMNSLCGTDFQCKGGPIPQIPGLPDIPVIPGWPGSEDYDYDGTVDYDYGGSTPPLVPGDIPMECVNYFVLGDSVSWTTCLTDMLGMSMNQDMPCPESCKSFFQGIPPNCQSFLSSLDNTWDDDILEWCGIPTNTSPQPDTPSPDLPPPSPIFPSLNSSFTCDEGDGFEWIALDADEASQWGEAGNDQGPQNAIFSNCTELAEGSACCSVTTPGPFPWWQYNMGASMTVKGVKLTPPSGTCCDDDDCTLEDTCAYEHLFNAIINVGDFSLPDFYLTPEYEELLQGVGGDAALAQPVVVGAMQAESAICNVVNEFDFITETDDLLPSALIGCGKGVLVGTGVVEPQGKYVTLSLPAGDMKSLALCGIEICAKMAAA